jgi:hypothetical protein
MGCVIVGRGGVSPPRAKYTNMATVWKFCIGRGDLAPTAMKYETLVGFGNSALGEGTSPLRR